MADSYVVISLLIVTMLELLVLQILHVSTLNLSGRLARTHKPQLPRPCPSAHMALPSTCLPSVAATRQSQVGGDVGAVHRGRCLRLQHHLRGCRARHVQTGERYNPTARKHMPTCRACHNPRHRSVLTSKPPRSTATTAPTHTSCAWLMDANEPRRQACTSSGCVTPAGCSPARCYS